ncbi:MAG: histidine phosphatase family protein [Eubacteriales bacterium]|nr:histidine phosphatase family protein [Eubacteriales bacterium]
MKLYLIRHGETKGNREQRYVGRTDEGLLPEGAAALAKKRMPAVARVYVSPLRRCRETARILYPDLEAVVVEELRECDFGDFEYKNYQELNGDPGYQRFIDTMGESGFPGGEDMKSFQRRCIRGLEKVLEQEAALDRAHAEETKQQELSETQQRQESEGAIALVVHGGTIMALLDHFSAPHRDYYDWQVKNGCGYEVKLVENEDGGFSMRDIAALDGGRGV